MRSKPLYLYLYVIRTRGLQNHHIDALSIEGIAVARLNHTVIKMLRTYQAYLFSDRHHHLNRTMENILLVDNLESLYEFSNSGLNARGCGGPPGRFQ